MTKLSPQTLRKENPIWCGFKKKQKATARKVCSTLQFEALPNEVIYQVFSFLRRADLWLTATAAVAAMIRFENKHAVCSIRGYLNTFFNGIHCNKKQRLILPSLQRSAKGRHRKMMCCFLTAHLVMPILFVLFIICFFIAGILNKN